MAATASAPTRFLDPNVIAAISGMELRARAIVEGFLSGLHQSPYKGFSVEFAEYRQYTPGDDPRHIDWKVYARSDKYYVKEFEEETNLNCHILIDISKSMSYASSKVSKLDYASFLSASLAYLMIRQRDSVGIVGFSDKIDFHIPSRLRPGHLHTIFHAIENISHGERTTIGKPLHQVADTLNKKGLLILLSDLLDEPKDIIDALQHFRFRGHDVVVFHILDKTELTFPFYSKTRFIGLEGEGSYMTIPQSIREDYMRRLQDHIETLKTGCGVHKIDYAVLDTSKPLDFALQAYLAARSGKM